MALVQLNDLIRPNWFYLKPFESNLKSERLRTMTHFLFVGAGLCAKSSKLLCNLLSTDFRFTVKGSNFRKFPLMFREITVTQISRVGLDVAANLACV